MEYYSKHIKNMIELKKALAIIVIVLSVLSALSFNQQSSMRENNSDKPNILLILADDAGYADFGFMGSKDMLTPNIDLLAAQGVVFTDAHVTATVCSPSRAGLITGRYQERFGHECNIPPYGLGMDTTEVTLANVLKDAGYATAIFGKWHLGLSPPYHPCNRGFDEFFGFLAGSRYYFPYKDTMKVAKERLILHNWERAGFDGYLTDVLGEKAIKFIDENKKQPFFIFLSFNAVHTPMQAKDEDLKKFEGHARQKLAAMTWSLDEAIGNVFNKLEVEGLMDNTLIFFLSDNGGATNNQSSNIPLKGFKGNNFEGGHRVPFIVMWNNKIKGNEKFEGLTSSLDVFATCMQAAGIKKSLSKPLDGVSLLPYLTEEKEGNPHQKIFWRKNFADASRDGDYKLIGLKNFGYRMYNLSNDLGESKDIQDVQQAQYKKMQFDLEQWEEQMNDPLWLESEFWQKRVYNITKNLMENKDPGINKH